METHDTARCLSLQAIEESPLTCVAFTPDSSRVLAGSQDKAVSVWDAAKGTCVAQWTVGACTSPSSPTCTGEV